MAKASIKSQTADISIPRPLNCFLLYRIEKQKEIVAKCPGANHRDISKIIAKWWKEATEEEKKPFREQARIAKQEHYKIYPAYKYAPKKKESRKRAYVRKNKHERFTSRSDENNKFMEMIYDHSKALEVVPQQSPMVKHERFTGIKSEQIMDYASYQEQAIPCSIKEEDTYSYIPFSACALDFSCYSPPTPATLFSLESPQSFGPSVNPSTHLFDAYSASPSLTDVTYADATFSGQSFMLSPYIYSAEEEFLFPALDISATPVDMGSPNTAVDLRECFNFDGTILEKFFENTSVDLCPMFGLNELPTYQPIEYIDPILLCNPANIL